MEEYVIGIDIGGTLARAIVLESTNFEIKDQLTEESSDNGLELVQIIKSLVRELENNTKQSFTSLGIGIAGLAHKSGIVRYSPNLPSLIEFPIADEIKKDLGIPVVVGNDATVGTIAEWKIGAGKGSENFALVTLGTGIGTGFVVNGNLLLGSNGFAGEAGHMTLDVNGPVHLTGQKGPWEYFASGNALNRIVENEASEGNYPWAVNEAGNWKNVTSEHLSSGVQNLVLLLDLDRIVLGGGVCEIGEPLRSRVEKWIQETLIGSEHRPKVEVKLAKLGSSAGAIGAAISTTNYF